ncbi:zonular occludens toxin domain-containing protein [Vibrio cholerae]|uniref:zonular occludens toxin domain-containing protein n=1 Tax=Vibrio cholerae TaxID=666 RepID=UPI001C310808|nr:zonular occludens toxin domain-containing protein [Vibrio cholerae]
MASFWVYGSIRAGKGIFIARKMQQYLARGSRVATNVNVFPEKLDPNGTVSITRLPDIPRIEDIKALGRGCPDGEKQKLGGLFLDETSIFLNARSWNDKDRAEWIAYIRLLGKMGWDVFFTTQDPESVDKQILAATGEEFIHCVRKDYFRIPVVSDFYDIYRIFKTKGQERESKILPHINEAAYRRGKTKLFNKPYRSEIYRPVQFFGTYDTNQMFNVDVMHFRGRDVDMRATYSLLPGQTLRKYEIIRNMQEAQAKQETTDMALTLDDIQLPKQKPPFPKWQLLFFLLFAFLAVFTWNSILSTDEPQQANQTQQTQTVKTESSNAPVPADDTPDYLKGVYISGWVLINKNGAYVYDYALHNSEHTGFDYMAYGLQLKPAAPCVAWLTTVDGFSKQITCRFSSGSKASDSSQLAQQQTSTLSNFSLGTIVDSTLESM